MKNYYERKIEISKLTLELAKEAISERLHNQEITSDKFALYAELLQDLEKDIEQNERFYQNLTEEAENNPIK